jgi:hypothetical protein
MNLNNVAIAFTDALEQLLQANKLNYFLYNRQIDQQGDKITTKIEMKGSKHSFIFDVAYDTISKGLSASIAHQDGDVPAGNGDKIVNVITNNSGSLSESFK